jgi:hypothetical protein
LSSGEGTRIGKRFNKSKVGGNIMAKVNQEESAKSRVLNNAVNSVLETGGKAAHRVKVIGRKKYLRITAILLNGVSQFGGLATG